jgi:hypothetical protein
MNGKIISVHFKFMSCTLFKKRIHSIAVWRMHGDSHNVFSLFSGGTTKLLCLFNRIRW